MKEEKKAIWERNQKNRTKNPNPMNHHPGPQPLRHWAEEHLEKGHPVSLVQACIDAYLPCKNDKEKVESLQNSLQAILQSRAEVDTDNVQAEPVPVIEQCKILIQVFGERRGT